MQTTINLPDDLYEQVELVAARDGVPVDSVIAGALRLTMNHVASSPRGRVEFPLHRSARPGSLNVEQARKAEEEMYLEEDAARANAM